MVNTYKYLHLSFFALTSIVCTLLCKFTPRCTEVNRVGKSYKYLHIFFAMPTIAAPCCANSNPNVLKPTGGKSI